MLQTVGRRTLADGRRVKVGQEVLRNMATGEVVATQKGWNAEPPRPSGDVDASVRHLAYGNEEFWANLEAQKHRTLGTVVKQGDGKTVIRY
jgi:hypothetical protein